MSGPQYSPRRRTALVLAGSGTAGAYHAGVLRALHEAGVRIDLIAGQGMGAASAMVAAIDGAARLATMLGADRPRLADRPPRHRRRHLQRAVRRGAARADCRDDRAGGDRGGDIGERPRARVAPDCDLPGRHPATATSDPTEVADALIQQARVSPRFAIGVLAALRLVPVLARDWRTIGLARRARGVEAGRSPFSRRPGFSPDG